MKKLMMLMLASGFVTISAYAEVGKDKTAPKCEQVIQSIQDALKRNRPAADNGVPGADARPAAAPAQ